MSDKLLEELDPAGALSGDELFYAVQGGADRQVTADQLADFTLTGSGSAIISPTPNAGQITRWTDSTHIQGSPLMFESATGVGINTTSPTAPLDVVGSGGSRVTLGGGTSDSGSDLVIRNTRSWWGTGCGYAELHLHADGVTAPAGWIGPSIKFSYKDLSAVDHEVANIGAGTSHENDINSRMFWVSDPTPGASNYLMFGSGGDQLLGLGYHSGATGYAPLAIKSSNPAAPQVGVALGTSTFHASPKLQVGINPATLPGPAGTYGTGGVGAVNCVSRAPAPAVVGYASGEAGDTGAPVGLYGIAQTNVATGSSWGFGGDAHGYPVVGVTVNEVAGGWVYAANDGAGTVTHLEGLRVFGPSNTGVVTNTYGIKIEDLGLASGLVNTYGIFIENQTPGSTSGWAIKTGTGKVEFGDFAYGVTATTGDASTKLATTAFVANSVTAMGGGDVSAVPTPTAGQIARWTGAHLIQGSPTLFEDGTGKVGIGTTGPGSRLEVISDNNVQPASTSAAIRVRSQNLTQYANYDWAGVYGSLSLIYNAVGFNSDAHVFQLAGTTKMVVRTDGNVGIGIAAPSYPLHVRRDQNDVTYLAAENDDAGANASAGLFLATATSYLFKVAYRAGHINEIWTGSGATQYLAQNATGQFIWYTGASPTEKMRLTNAGNLGIGVAAPDAKLNVIGGVTTSPTPLAATLAHFVGDSSNNRVVFDGIATNAGIIVRRANGTVGSPSALAVNDIIGAFNAFGYGATGYATAPRAQVTLYAAETWTDTAQGTNILFTATPINSTATAEVVRFAWSGSIFNSQCTFPVQTLTDAATISWDVSTRQKAKVTLAGNRTMAAVTNAVEGTTYYLWVIQDATGSRTLAFTTTGAGSFDFGVAGVPTLTTGAGSANKADLLTFEAITIAGTLKLRYCGIAKGFA